VSDPPPPQRLKHPDALVFLLGGIVGAAVNVAVTLAAHLWLRWDPLLAIFLGTLANQLWHFVFYAVVFVQEEARWRLRPVPRALIFVAVAASSAGLLWLFLQTGLDFVPAVLAVLVLLSLANFFLVRVTSFSSARLAEIEYRAMDESYYDDHTDAKKVGWFRAWFHHSRFVNLTRFVDRHYRPGMRIADLGCGNCWWNTNSLPVTGADINEKMLSWAQRHSRVHEFQVCTDLAHTGLPDGQFDIVVMSETLEHLINLTEVLAEVRRVLKPDGVFLITVPYDFILSPFFVLFNVHCAYQGFIKGSQYHKYRCGHIHHFNKRRLRRLLNRNGFEVKETFIVNGLTLYASAEITDHGGT
jgi:2-polyprenyl-3-methyl-5-hydroxy-6-metoxy-1,4-benzoquinol methylase/putative flippase GtrA